MNGISIMTKLRAELKTVKAGRGRSQNRREKNFFADPEAVKRVANAYGLNVTNHESGELFTALIIYTRLMHGNEAE